METDLDKIKDILTKHYCNIKNIKVLLDIVFPILLCFENDNKYYICYIITFNKRKNIINMLVTETTRDDLLNIIHQKTNVRKTFVDKTVYYISNDHCLFREINKKELKDLLPDEYFFLSDLLPNKVDISLIDFGG